MIVECLGCGAPAPTNDPTQWSTLCPMCAPQYYHLGSCDSEKLARRCFEAGMLITQVPRNGKFEVYERKSREKFQP